MKRQKLMIFLCSIALFVVLTACGVKNENVSDTTDPVEELETEESVSNALVAKCGVSIGEKYKMCYHALFSDECVKTDLVFTEDDKLEISAGGESKIFDIKATDVENEFELQTGKIRITHDGKVVKLFDEDGEYITNIAILEGNGEGIIYDQMYETNDPTLDEVGIMLNKDGSVDLLEFDADNNMEIVESMTIEKEHVVIGDNTVCLRGEMLLTFPENENEIALYFVGNDEDVILIKRTE